MHDVAVLKAAEHVSHGVHVPDVGEELVAQTLALGGAAHQTGDIHEFDNGGGVELGIVHLRQTVQTAVRHRHHAYVGIDGAEGIVGADGTCTGDGIEERGLAYVGQTDNSDFHTV